MAFLPLLALWRQDEDESVHPYEADRRAERHHRQMLALAEADAVLRMRRHRATVLSWRLALGHRLVAVGLRLGLPPGRRSSARRHARALLAGEEAAADRRLPTTP